MDSGYREREQVHLVVLIHGLYGSAQNLHTVRDELLALADRDQTQLDEGEVEALLDQLAPAGSSDSASRGSKHRLRGGEGRERDTAEKTGRRKLGLEILLCKSFEGSRTWDGVDVNAHRASQEIDSRIAELSKTGQDVGAISILGYSLGGLVARYLVGLLHHRSPSFFDTHQPATFSTMATPHLGVLKYGSTLNTVVHTIGRRLFSRAGKQLYCLDKEWDGRCLLDVLADPDHIFVQALQLFPEVRIIANGCNDLTVPYPTASISLHDPFENHEVTRIKVEADEDCIVTGWHVDVGCESHANGQLNGNGQISTLRRKEEDAQWRELDEEFKELTAEEEAFSVANMRLRTRPRLPPFLFLKGWKRYLPLILLPLLLPLWLCFIFGVFTLHTYQSASRHRTFLSSSDSSALRPIRHTLPSPTDTDPAERLQSVSAALAASTADGSSHPMPLRRRVRQLVPSESQESSTAPSRASTPHLDPRPPPPPAQAVQSTPMRLSRSTQSASIPHVHPHAHSAPFHPSRTPLHLTSLQENMVVSLHRALPQMTKVIMWFPWEYNSHPTIVVRMPGRFPARNVGRGALKKWARWVRDVGEEEIGIQVGA